MKLVRIVLPFLAVALAIAQEQHPSHGVPEIDLTVGGTAIALFLGAILVIRGRRKKITQNSRNVTG